MTKRPKKTSPPKGIPTIRVVAMPTDTNPAGDIFGGWIVSQMDLAAGSKASFRANGRCVTVAINSLVFLEPVIVGDEVSIYTKIIRVGRTSLTIHVETWRRARDRHQTSQVTEGEFIFVAIDENRTPRPLPPLDSLPDEKDFF